MNNGHHVEATSLMATNAYGTDGALDRVLRLGQKSKYAPAIFIHAGAGFHSHQNERVHLEACVSYGPYNLICDTKVNLDHLVLPKWACGSSKLVLPLPKPSRHPSGYSRTRKLPTLVTDPTCPSTGLSSAMPQLLTISAEAELAVLFQVCFHVSTLNPSPNDYSLDIRNPISLAKLILDTSNKPLSLRRVPPNALVGEGAKTFAEEHGMVTYPNENLVSKNARDRFLRWQEDLKRAEGKVKVTKSRSAPDQDTAECMPCQYDTAPSPSDVSRVFPRDHAAAIVSGTWNEGQPDSPYYGTPVPEAATDSSTSYFRIPNASAASSGRPALRPVMEKNSSGSPGSASYGTGSSSWRSKPRCKKTEVTTQAGSESNAASRGKGGHSYRDALASDVPRNQMQSDGIPDEHLSSMANAANPHGIKRRREQVDESHQTERTPSKYGHPFQSHLDGEDVITDTIGAIAVDDKGHIAAGSSSGGIGMKHQGRLGPAALVGIGTAVVPSAEDDEEGVSVAAVTSGTGEHMATTMASQRCAERIYRGARKGVGGAEIYDDDEDAIMESFIADDFMNHPGVKYCHSAGAIGVMVVKKTRSGYYFYFAHNTDSFALASMGGLDSKPVCTMSRLPKGANIAKGGRKVRID